MKRKEPKTTGGERDLRVLPTRELAVVVGGASTDGSSTHGHHSKRI